MTSLCFALNQQSWAGNPQGLSPGSQKHAGRFCHYRHELSFRVVTVLSLLYVFSPFSSGCLHESCKPLNPTLCRTDYVMCKSQCKMKMQGPLFKNYQEFQDDKSRDCKYEPFLSMRQLHGSQGHKVSLNPHFAVLSPWATDVSCRNWSPASIPRDSLRNL